jgi:hypothetical protein
MTEEDGEKENHVVEVEDVVLHAAKRLFVVKVNQCEHVHDQPQDVQDLQNRRE